MVSLRPAWTAAAAAALASGLALAQTVRPPVPGASAPTLRSSPATAPSASSPEIIGNVIETRRQPAGGGRVVPPAPVENGAPRSLTVGEVTTLPMPGVARIAIGNGRLVKATVVDDNQIVLLAEAAGETTMHVWTKAGRQISYPVRVQAAKTDRLMADIAELLKGSPTLHARPMGDRIVIEGRFPDTETAAKVKLLAESFPQILNLVPARPADADPLQMERMVYLDIRVVEVKRRALEQLGIKWPGQAQGPTLATNGLLYANTPWRPDTTNGFPAVSTAQPFATYFGMATQIASALNFLEQAGDAWALAEPRLSCRSGGSSTFLAGGEIPIPVPQAMGAIGVEYKKYGVVVEFRPQADAAGNIESGIVIEVSEPDPRNSNQGFIAFTTSKTETQVAMRQGEPLVISGLFKQKADRGRDGIPGASRLPVVGRLFGTTDRRTEETELIVIVHPRVVSPDSKVNKDAIERADEMKRTTGQAARDHLERTGGADRKPAAATAP